MAWWKTRLGSSAAGRADEPTWPIELEVVPGKLSARVYLHDIDFRGKPIACWSYVSHGLAALEQPDIVFTLRRERGESSDGFPQDPLHLLATIYQLADDGQRVGPGDVTGFGAPGFLGHHLLYVETQPLDGVPLAPSCLTALLITTDELRAVAEFGSTRVLARMGQASGYYPFPPWADRRRPGLSFARTFEQSLLSKLPRAASHDVRVAVESNQIIVSALRGAQPPWQDRLAELSDNVPLTLLTALDPTANGCLVWVPGQSAPEAITPTGKRWLAVVRVFCRVASRAARERRADARGWLCDGADRRLVEGSPQRADRGQGRLDPGGRNRDVLRADLARSGLCQSGRWSVVFC
jgi:hypothetical protein